MCVCVRFPQAGKEQELKSSREQKDRSDNQHQVELTALSSNLASLRQQGENSRKRLDQYDKKVKGLTEELEGVFVCV